MRKEWQEIWNCYDGNKLHAISPITPSTSLGMTVCPPCVQQAIRQGGALYTKLFTSLAHWAPPGNSCSHLFQALRITRVHSTANLSLVITRRHLQQSTYFSIKKTEVLEYVQLLWHGQERFRIW